METLLIISTTIAVTTGIAAIFFGFAWYRERGRYRSMLSKYPEPMIRFNIETLEPLLCNESFSTLLGYDTPGECCHGFLQSGHLSNLNLFQIIRSHLSGSGIQAIQISDRSGRPIGGIVGVTSDLANGHLDLIVRDSNIDEREYEGFLDQKTFGYIETDESFRVTGWNAVAEASFDLSMQQTFFDSALPVDLRQRIENIYRKRLSRHTKLELTHPARIRSGEAVNGRWVVLRRTLGYHLFFIEESLSSSALDLPLYNLMDHQIGFWKLDLTNNEIRHNPAWFPSLHYHQFNERCPLERWLQLVSPEDRKAVSLVLRQGRSEFRFLYRMATGEGVEIQVESRAVVVSRDTSGTPEVIQGIHINRSAAGLREDSDDYSLAIVATNLGYQVDDVHDLDTSADAQQLEGILAAIGDHVVAEYGQSVHPFLKLDPGTMLCSSCRDQVLRPVTLSIVCEEAVLPQELLGQVLQVGFSQNQLPFTSRQSSLARVNRRIHDLGGHLSIASNGISQVIFRLGLPAREVQATVAKEAYGAG